jgi:hypothetical protein
MAKRAKESESERELGIVKVDEPAVAVEAKPELPPAPPIVPPETPPQTASGPSFGEQVARFFRFLLRLVSLLLILAIISVALYYVLPWLYQKYITPVEQNTVQVRELQSRLERTEQELASLQTRLETIETVQNQQDGSLTEIDERLTDIETEITARTESLAALERMQSELQAQNEATSIELQRQINLLKSMELLSRARLFMYQSNFGLAEQDIQIARDLLATIRPDAPQPLADELGAVLLRLDLTLSNLPNFPVAASDDLDIAWQILLSGLPKATPTVIETPTLVVTFSSTPAATDVTITPTPPAIVTPSPTP